MVQKSQGFVHLYWNCPHCNSQNIGKQNVCAQCGSPQPDNVEFFHLEASQIIHDESEIKRAALGPDIYCPYCKSRNTADTKICIQCGGDIAEGIRRQSGAVKGAFKSGGKQTIPCKACGAENAFNRAACHQCGAGLAAQPAKTIDSTSVPKTEKKKMGTVGIVFMVLIFTIICGFILWGVSGLFAKEELEGVVQTSQWQYTINIERFGSVENEDWQSAIPSDATIISCEDKYHHEETQFTSNAEEVCGTPYTVDKGNGYAEVVQDCVYRVYEPFCSYQTTDWAYDTSYTANGSDLNPVLPAYTLSSDQRIAEEIEEYVIYFSSGSDTYEYTTSDYSEFSACQPGSHWTLTTNSFGAVLTIQPST